MTIVSLPKMLHSVARKGLGISSLHPGSSSQSLGANVVFADGHTKWLENGTPAETIRAMLTVKGGEKIEEP